MLSHGTAPAGLLLSTMVPLIKNKRGNKCDSNNYRAIAISSLLGKLFDTILLKLQHASFFMSVASLLNYYNLVLNLTHLQLYARPFYETLLNIIMKMAVTVIYYS